MFPMLTACNQQSLNLPKEKITKQHPFAVTDVDFAGPLYVTDTDEKHYICLYTCMTIRAVRLELTSSLKHVDFLKSFRRFSASRGMPVETKSMLCMDTKHPSGSLLHQDHIGKGPAGREWFTQ